MPAPSAEILLRPVTSPFPWVTSACAESGSKQGESARHRGQRSTHTHSNDVWPGAGARGPSGPLLGGMRLLRVSAAPPLAGRGEQRQQQGRAEQLVPRLCLLGCASCAGCGQVSRGLASRSHHRAPSASARTRAHAGTWARVASAASATEKRPRRSSSSSSSSRRPACQQRPQQSQRRPHQQRRARSWRLPLPLQQRRLRLPWRERPAQLRAPRRALRPPPSSPRRPAASPATRR